MGIEVYATSSLGVGGIIRQRPEGFIVEEILVDGSKAEVRQSKKRLKSKALGSSSKKNRYLLCVLVKRNWDTFLAVKAVAQKLGMNSNSIQIAGIKDARAVTAQHVTIENVSAEELQKVYVKDLKVRPIGYFHSNISSYFLLGNNFHIAISAINHSKSTIEKRIAKTIEELKATGGAPNFFGHQRFGTTRPITHLVGKAVIQGNFRKAAMIFLAKPSPHEHPESREARRQLQTTQDFKQALKNFPRKLYYERLMLKHLTEKPNGFVEAFKKLPTKLRKLFPQAYQAYLFNKFLSRRIRTGLPRDRAEVGDHVVNVEASGLPMFKMHRTVSTGKIAEINRAIRNGRMYLTIPLVGFKQRLSQGLQGEIERQILEEEEVSPGSFKIEAMPEISLRGGLRSAMTPIKDFLLDEVLEDSANSSKRQAKVTFTLYRGSYATILLRELMKPCNPLKAGF